MNEQRRRILQMLAENKITADEAERLIIALDTEPQAAAPTRSPKYLRVLVDADDDKDGPSKVNIRVPMMLLRAGVRLGALLPAQARDQINRALSQKGIDFDVGQIKPENLEALIEQLSDLTVNIDQDRNKVRIFCE